MKKYALILISIFVLFVFGVSTVLASISLPPSDPNNNPPGPFLSAEELEKGRIAENARKDLQRKLRYCDELWYSGHWEEARKCQKRAYKDYHDSLKAIYHPPTLILPNGGSPGGK